jgi:hypothetical protein
MNLLQMAILAIGLCGFAVAFVVQFRLKHHVSLEKVRATEDPAQLYPSSIPPKAVLTDDGTRLWWHFQLGAGLFIVSVIALILTTIIWY